ncbi:MAG: glycosyltransferase family 2 protein [Nannocystaceae bacterium]|nr:glycosyltransferase [bacterium]
MKSRILESLVSSAIGDSPRVALDLTRTGVASRTLRAGGVLCHRAPIAEHYDVVVCTMRDLVCVRPLVGPDGSLIVHIKPGQHGELLGMAGEYALVASARTPTGAWLRLRRTGDSAMIAPRVSVVVATRNDAALLAQLLSTLEDQPTDPAWDLVVVDRSSTDATSDLLGRVEGDLRRIRVAADCDPIDALYAGLRAARGDVLVPVPPGLAPSCGFVSALVRYVDQHQAARRPLLGGVVTLDGRRVPDAACRAMARAATPTTPRRLAKWFARADGVEIPGFRMRQLIAGPVPSLGCDAERFDGPAQPQPNAVLAQRRERLEQRG